MKTSHHTMELIEIPLTELKDTICSWLVDTGFTVTSNSSQGLKIKAKIGSNIGISDQKTARVMEIILREQKGITAISIYHHTTTLGPVVGVMKGEILKEEVNNLLEVISEMTESKC